MLKLKYLKNILIAFLCGTILLLYFVLFKIDPSSTDISPIMTQSIDLKPYQPERLNVLVNYGGRARVFLKNQNSLLGSAADKGFNMILSYHKGHIDPEFYHRNKAILEQPRGAGYWLWKPYFILKTMKSLPDDTVIFYADSGVIFTQPLDKLMELLKKYEMILVGYGKPIPIRNHLKKEAYNLFPQPVTEKILDSQHLWGFFLVIKNTSANRQLIQKWLDMAQNKDALTDEPFDKSIQDPAFQDHLHDETLLGVLVANEPEGKIIIPRNVLRKEYGVNNFHRQREQEFTSPLFIVAGVPQWLSTIFWNNPLFVALRKWIHD